MIHSNINTFVYMCNIIHVNKFALKMFYNNKKNFESKYKQLIQNIIGISKLSSSTTLLCY